MGDYLDDMACCGDRGAIAELARREGVRSAEGKDKEMIDRVCAVVINYLCQRDETCDLGEGADIAMYEVAKILGIEEPVPDPDAVCPKTGGAHQLDGRSVVGADGAPGIVDVNCSACGRSGSFALDPTTVNW